MNAIANGGKLSFSGSHTSDAIAAKLNSIIQEFNLGGKVVAVVTDNGSNFVKAFQDYQEPLEEDEENIKLETEEHFGYADVDDDEYEPSPPAADNHVTSVGSILSSDPFPSFTLPPHIR